jgi:hypothetical protein
MMTSAAAHLPAALSSRVPRQAEPPVVPDSDEARRWAVEELSKPKYQEATPTWLENAWRDFVDWLNSLGSNDGTDTGSALPLITIAAVIVIAVAIVLVRPRLNARRKDSTKAILDVDPSVSPEGYRKRAAAAAAAADWGTAVIEQFRAVVRSAEERTIIDPLPGRTADEVAMSLGAAFSPFAWQLERAAIVFDAVHYGQAHVDQQDFADIVALDESISRLQPDFKGSLSHTLARPL